MPMVWWSSAGSKNTPAPKMGVEVVGTTGRLIMDDVGDGKNPAGEWTGTYKNTGVIWRGDKQVSMHAAVADESN